MRVHVQVACMHTSTRYTCVVWRLWACLSLCVRVRVRPCCACLRVIRLYHVRLVENYAPERGRLGRLFADKLAHFGWQPSNDTGDAVPAQQNRNIVVGDLQASQGAKWSGCGSGLGSWLITRTPTWTGLRRLRAS